MIGFVLPLLLVTPKTQFSLDRNDGIVSGIRTLFSLDRYVKFYASYYDSDSVASESQPSDNNSPPGQNVTHEHSHITQAVTAIAESHLYGKRQT